MRERRIFYGENFNNFFLINDDNFFINCSIHFKTVESLYMFSRISEDNIDSEFLIIYKKVFPQHITFLGDFFFATLQGLLGKYHHHPIVGISIPYKQQPARQQSQHTYVDTISYT